MWVSEREFVVGDHASAIGSLSGLCATATALLQDNEILLRAIVNGPQGTGHSAAALILSGADDAFVERASGHITLRRRPFENTDRFLCVVMVPTGVGCEIGGHAGDAGSVVRLVSEICDQVITHPNVVNASDINESPPNTLYVEGSVLTRLLLGNIVLQPVRNNRVLVVIDEHPDCLFSNAAINAVNAARATYGLECSQILKLTPGVRLQMSYSSSGRAIGEVTNLTALIHQLVELKGSYDAVALSSVINVPAGYHQGYFDAAGTMINPWGGVEAMLTHAISTLFDVPSAHSPMFETRDIANSDPGIVDGRMAAEAVSFTFLQSVLKGLQRSPKILPDLALGQAGVLDATDISCLLLPDGCFGIATLAALEQGISVIAVRENESLMSNDLTALPWRTGQLTIVENYWEAAGVMAAIKAGISPNSVRRPLRNAPVSTALLFGDLLHANALDRSEMAGKRPPWG